MADNPTEAAYSTAQAQTDAQKRALLQAIADSGTAGQKAYENAQTQIEQSRKQALNQLAPVAGFAQGSDQFTTEQQGIANAPYLQRQADLAQGAAVFGADIQRQSAANEDYFSKVSAAIPIEQTVTQRAVEQMLKQQEQQRLDRENQLRLGELQVQAAQAAASNRGGNSGPSIGEALAMAAAAEGKKQDVFNNILQSYAVDDTGQEITARSNAINKIVNLGVDVESAWRNAPDADKNAIRDAVNRYYATIGGDSPFTAYDAQWQAAHPGIRGGLGLGGSVKKSTSSSSRKAN